MSDHSFHILTNSRKYFDFENIESNVFDINDIAHGLSHVCRYAGQVPKFYSVAQHSILVSQMVPPKEQLAGLLHDATEAYMQDVPKPLKMLLPDYKRIENEVQAALFKQFGLDPVIPESVHKADAILLGGEKRELWGNTDNWALLRGVPEYPYSIEPWSSIVAKEAFLFHYRLLTGDFS